MSDLIYGVATKAWQPIVGCDPKMPCAKRCWARRTVARIKIRVEMPTFMQTKEVRR